MRLIFEYNQNNIISIQLNYMVLFLRKNSCRWSEVWNKSNCFSV